jgi:hypothetical protein
MTDQFSSLTPAAMLEIIREIDASLAILDRYRMRPTAAQIRMRSMLLTVRAELIEQLTKAKSDESWIS